MNQDANYRPAHAALAEYYEKQGDTDRAVSHCRLAGEERDNIGKTKP
jgi:Tfp pilus assembly protein PilF